MARKKDKGWDYLNSDSLNDAMNEGQSGDYGYSDSDGSESYHGGDGSWGYKNPDGSSSYYGSDGSWGYKNPDGSGSYYGGDGSWGYKNPDGSSTYYGANGSYAYKNADGSGSYYGGDDSPEDSEEYNSDNSSEQSYSSSSESTDGPGLGTLVGLGLLGLTVAAINKSKNDNNEETYEDIVRRDAIREEAARKAAEEEAIREEKVRISAQKRKAWLKKHWKGLSVSILLLLVLSSAAYGIHEFMRRIPVGYNSSDLLGQNYEDVVKRLKVSGFQNVYTNIEFDLSIEDIKEEYLVTDIIIGETEVFSEKDKFFPETRVEVTYHMVEPISTPMSSKEAKGKNYEDVKESFAEAGFVNIDYIVDYDIITGWMTKVGEVESITIGDEKKFESGSLYRPDEPIVITYHDLRKNKPK